MDTTDFVDPYDKAKPPSALDVQIGGGHYKNMRIQPAEFSELNGLSFLEGCVVKRVSRHKSAKGYQDICKAVHELRLIARLIYEKDIE